MVDDIPGLRRILATNKMIAVVGLSADWFRPSYFAAKYMQEHGYAVIPVNPRYEAILGQKCYKSLRDIPGKVDIVDVFRKSADVGPIADDAIAIGAKVLWQQLGVTNVEAARKAEAAGLEMRDGPLREDRARAALRRAQLGRREHQGHFGQAAEVHRELRHDDPMPEASLSPTVGEPEGAPRSRFSPSYL